MAIVADGGMFTVSLLFDHPERKQEVANVDRSCDRRIRG
jgi:hypothetical protein